MVISYLHYHFANNKSSFGSADYNVEKQKEILRQQKQAWNDRNKSMLASTKGTTELGNVISFLAGKDSSQLRKQVYDAERGNIQIPSFNVDGISIGTLGYRKNGAFGKTGFAKAQELVNHFDLFKTGLDNALCQSYQVIKEELDSIKGEIVNDYLKSKRLAEKPPDFNQQVIKEFLKHDGLKSFRKKGDSPSQTAKRKLALLASVLPEFDMGSATSLKYSTKSSKKGDMEDIHSEAEFIAILAGKCSGMWNSVISGVGEVGALHAEKIVAKKVAEELGVFVSGERTGTRQISGESFSVTKKTQTNSALENWIQENKKAQTNKVVSKGDATIVLTENDVEAHYGLTVKELSGLSPNIDGSVTASVKLVDSTNFLEAANRAFSGNGIAYMYNLAGGHGDSKQYTNAELDSMWEQLKQTVVVSNTLHALAGLPSENVIYMVVNGQAFSIGDVIQQIIDRSQDNYSPIGASFKMVKRATMMNKNRWITIGNSRKTQNKDAANQRSQIAIDEISQYLLSAKMTIHLNFLLSIMK